MSDSNNKRIAKNTLFLYIRMVLVMGVTLYTSRIVLFTLGVDDFGIYNVVGGIVILFAFLKGSITTAIQRYINFAIGIQDNSYKNIVFSSSFKILTIFALVIILILETIGLWFVNNKLTLPSNSLYVTNIVYQLSIISFVISIYRTPYDALIMAHERMSFYAITSIIETVLKLAVAFSLTIILFNKLILYSILILIVTALMSIIYYIYCKKNYNLSAWGKTDKKIIKEITSFSGWNIFGGIADVGYQQGTNIILNLFYGVSFNATMGIANQIKGAIFSFVRNIIVAANPQIYQSFATNDLDRYQNIVIKISKFAFFMFLIIAIPLIFNMEYILKIWLIDIPPMANIFCILTIIFCTIDSFIGPLWTAAQAEGDIKTYQIVSSSITLLNLPISYLCYFYEGPAYSLLIVQIILVIISLGYRIHYLSSKNLISIKIYLRDVIKPSLMVLTISILTCILIEKYTVIEPVYKLFFTVPLYISLTIIIISIFGINQGERKLIIKQIAKFIHHKSN